MPRNFLREIDRRKNTIIPSILFVAVIALLLKENFGKMKYSYKEWISAEASAAHTAYQADKLFEDGDYLKGLEYLVIATICSATEITQCDDAYHKEQERIQNLLKIELENATFIERHFQVGVDEVTALTATHTGDWIEWGSLADGSLLTMTKLGPGRSTELLTDEDIYQRIKQGARPAFLFRVEEGDTRDYREIGVVKAPSYTGKDFETVTSQSSHIVMGVNTSGQLVLNRGGELSADKYSVGSRVYWPIDMNAATLDTANSHGNLTSFIWGMDHECKSPSYDCNWVSSVASDSEGNIYEMRLSMSLLYDDETWPHVLRYLKSKGIVKWAFSDPMFEESMLSAVDQVIQRDLLRTAWDEERDIYKDTDPVDILRKIGVEDGLYIVIWDDGESKTTELLGESAVNDFLKQ